MDETVNIPNNGKLLKTLAFKVLTEDAKNDYTKNKYFSDELLLTLHSLFGAVFLRATELLDNCKFTLYQTQDGFRKLLKIRNKSEEYSIFCDVNFCRCQAFKYQVLQSKSAFTCKHYVASKLVEVTGKYKSETLTDLQFIELLKCLNE